MKRSERDSNTKKVLLVGGAGYIGSVLTGQLLKNGYKVRCLDRLLYRNHNCVLPFLNEPEYEFFYGDMLNDEILNRALHGVTDIVILAGLVGDPITKKYPEASKKINFEGILKVIHGANNSGIDKLIFISTCSNYGLIKENQLADEEFELKPLSLYAEAKVAVENEILSLKGIVDYNPIILRFATAFGLSPRMRFDLTVNEFTRDLFCGKELLVYDANTWRPYCHVLDFSLILEKTLEAPGKDIGFEVFNAGGSDNNYTKQMIVDEIVKIVPNAKVRYKDYGADPRNYRVNFNKIREVLGFEPKYKVTDGINSIIGTLKENLFNNIDQNRDFYGNYKISYE